MFFFWNWACNDDYSMKFDDARMFFWTQNMLLCWIKFLSCCQLKIYFVPFTSYCLNCQALKLFYLNILKISTPSKSKRKLSSHKKCVPSFKMSNDIFLKIFQHFFSLIPKYCYCKKAELCVKMVSHFLKLIENYGNLYQQCEKYEWSVCNFKWCFFFSLSSFRLPENIILK